MHLISQCEIKSVDSRNEEMLYFLLLKSLLEKKKTYDLQPGHKCRFLNVTTLFLCLILKRRFCSLVAGCNTICCSSRKASYSSIHLLLAAAYQGDSYVLTNSTKVWIFPREVDKTLITDEHDT